MWRSQHRGSTSPRFGTLLTFINSFKALRVWTPSIYYLLTVKGSRTSRRDLSSPLRKCFGPSHNRNCLECHVMSPTTSYPQTSSLPSFNQIRIQLQIFWQEHGSEVGELTLGPHIKPSLGLTRSIVRLSSQGSNPSRVRAKVTQTRDTAIQQNRLNTLMPAGHAIRPEKFALWLAIPSALQTQASNVWQGPNFSNPGRKPCMLACCLLWYKERCFPVEFSFEDFCCISRDPCRNLGLPVIHVQGLQGGHFAPSGTQGGPYPNFCPVNSVFVASRKALVKFASLREAIPLRTKGTMNILKKSSLLHIAHPLSNS